jgi:hypothetical protein
VAEAVFLNVPFTEAYGDLLVALVAGLTALGLEPRSVLDAVVPQNADRLERLKNVIKVAGTPSTTFHS